MIVSESPLHSNGAPSRTEASNALRRSLPLLGLGLAAAVLTGCGSSSSSPAPGAGFQHAAPRYAEAGQANYASLVESAQQDTVRMNQHAYRADQNGATSFQGAEAANFTIRANNGARGITIETADFSHTWDNATAADGIISATALTASAQGGPLDRLAAVNAEYYDFVGFGTWNQRVIDVNGNQTNARGGAFHQGLETNPNNIPTSGSATYTGTTHGMLFQAGQADYAFDGTVQLTANFGGAAPAISGNIQTDFNNIGLTGTISGNAFSGTTSASGSNGARSFADGAAGTVDGRFYGTAAQEVGGVWNIQDGNNFAVGGFGGRQQP